MKSNSCGFVPLVFAAVFLSSVTACGGGDEDGSRVKPVPSAAQNDINPMPRENLRNGGTFTWPLNELPPNFNYNQLDGTLHDNYVVVAALLPSPYTTDASGTPLWNKDLFASEPRIVTDPKQVVTFHINPKAVWYDGTPITWEDFHWQWKAVNGTDKRYQISSATGYEKISSVEKGSDDREVIITFSAKFTDWQSIFYLLYPASANKDPKVFNEGWTDKPLMTAGPFKLASLDKTSQTITLVRNEKWWGNPALLDTIVFRTIVPDAQIDAVANGEVDAIDMAADANKYGRAKALTNVDIRAAGGPNYRHLTLNSSNPILSDLRVRRAIAMGIDRATIARALLGPLGIDPKSLDNHIYMTNQAGYKNTSGETGQYNPVKAATLLDSAGWKLEGAVRKKDGKILEVDLLIPAAVAAAKQETEIMQHSLAGIGVTAKIRTVPGPDFFPKNVIPGQFGMTVFSWMGTAYPISGTKSLYDNPTKNADGTLDVHQNYARVGSRQIDSLFDAANSELDRGKALELANTIDSLIWEEVHSLTLYQRPELIAVKKGLANFGAHGFAIPWVYQDIGWVK